MLLRGLLWDLLLMSLIVSILWRCMIYTDGDKRKNIELLDRIT